MKKIIVTVLSIIMLFSMLTARANEPPNEIEWNVEDGILTVSGTGEMTDYANPDEAPWYAQRESITEIRISEGITRIGNLAFYGLTNAKKAVIADTVKSIGLCAFSYTEGTRTSISEIASDYSFTIESDSSVVSKDTEFTVSVNLEADYKDVAVIQAIVLFDKEKIAIDKNGWYDNNWYASIDETNLGYIGKPRSGIVANNLRLAYISLDGKRIDSSSALYTAGKTKLTIAKIRCKALTDLEDVNTSCFVIKDCSVSLAKDSAASQKIACAMTQLTTSTRLPMNIELVYPEKSGASAPAKDEASTQPSGITVKAGSVNVEYDVSPYLNDSGVMLIPLRHTAEALGAVVSWNNETRLALTYYNDKISVVQIGQDLIFENSGETLMASEALIKGGRTMVPLDFFEKALGSKVTYDTKTNTITIE